MSHQDHAFVGVGYEKTDSETSLLVFNPDWSKDQRRVARTDSERIFGPFVSRNDSEPDWHGPEKDSLTLFRYGMGEFDPECRVILVYFSGSPLLSASERELKKSEEVPVIWG